MNLGPYRSFWRYKRQVKQEGSAAVSLLGIFLGFLVVACMVIINGGIFSLLWRWFLEPLGAPHINIPTAIGISCIVSLLTSSRSNKEDNWINLVGQWVVRILIILAIAWTAHQFI